MSFGSGPPPTLESLTSALEHAGFPDARAEAGELMSAACGDVEVLRDLAARRVHGEPLAWLTGSTVFLGSRVRVEPGVYVPRPQTEPLARRAIERLPESGLAVDLATGSGALAVAMTAARPRARVVASDLDPAACRCARSNGVEVFEGDLGRPFPGRLRGSFDVVVGVVPYVPTDEIVFLPRDVRRYEPLVALDGGGGGLEVLEEAVRWGATLLRPGGALLLELGGHQDEGLRPVLDQTGFVVTDRLVDGDGDLRGVEAVLSVDRRVHLPDQDLGGL